jgi:hypothetical protein
VSRRRNRPSLLVIHRPEIPHRRQGVAGGSASLRGAKEELCCWLGLAGGRTAGGRSEPGKLGAADAMVGEVEKICVHVGGASRSMRCTGSWRRGCAGIQLHGSGPESMVPTPGAGISLMLTWLPYGVAVGLAAQDHGHGVVAPPTKETAAAAAPAYPP